MLSSGNQKCVPVAPKNCPHRRAQCPMSDAQWPKKPEQSPTKPYQWPAPGENFYSFRKNGFYKLPGLDRFCIYAFFRKPEKCARCSQKLPPQTGPMAHARCPMAQKTGAVPHETVSMASAWRKILQFPKEWFLQIPGFRPVLYICFLPETRKVCGWLTNIAPTVGPNVPCPIGGWPIGGWPIGGWLMPNGQGLIVLVGGSFRQQ